MSTQKYELTGTTKVNDWGVTVHQIRATEDIPRFGIRKGDLGGWVESETLRNGDARVSGDAWVYGNAQVFGDAQVYGDARVFGDAQVYGDARVFGNAQVYGDARVSGNAQVYGDARVSGNARVYGNARVETPWHYLVVGPIGSEGVTATLFRTKDGKHRLNVGCWDGTLGTLMAEVKRRREDWFADEAVQDVWVAQYRALKTLGKATVARWAL